MDLTTTMDDCDQAARRALLDRAHAEHSRHDLAGHVEDRKRVGVCTRDAGEGVGPYGPRGDATHREVAAHARVGVRHERGTLFVARHHVAHAIALPQRGEQRRQWPAGHAEDVGHPFALELLQDLLDERHAIGDSGYVISIRFASNRRGRAKCIAIAAS